MLRGTTIWIAALCFAAAPARAVENTTGIYEGKLKCAGLIEGTASKFKADVTVAIGEDELGNVNMGVNAPSNLNTGIMNGFVSEDSAKPDRGRISAVSCPLNYDSRNGTALQMEVVVKPGGAKASVEGTLIDMTRGDGTTFLCTFTAKRTATKAPVFKVCPI